MFDIELIEKQLQGMKKRASDIGDSLCISELEAKLNNLEEQTMKQCRRI